VNQASSNSVVNKTVLIVEDEPGLRKMLGQYLSLCGCSVITEAEGRSALNRLNNPDDIPDLILTDINLPGMDGYELLAQIRLKYTDIPVVLMTGLSSENIKSDISVQPDAILRKPISLSDLGETLFNLMKIDHPNQSKPDGADRL